MEGKAGRTHVVGYKKVLQEKFSNLFRECFLGMDITEKTVHEVEELVRKKFNRRLLYSDKMRLWHFLIKKGYEREVIDGKPTRWVKA